MANIEQLYKYFENEIPSALSCEWDNDGKMCVPCPERSVKRVLVSLDISKDAVEYAAKNNFDCIISHHPLIFDPLSNLDAQDHIAEKVCMLIKNGISAFSFHTRLDKVQGGVNDVLADALGLCGVSDFSDVGRMGETKPIGVKDFAKLIKEKLNADKIVCVDGGKAVSKIAVVGGSGKGYLAEVKQCGCDTFVTGEMPYNCEHEAKELGINLICAGHYFTENLVCERIEDMVKCFDEGVYTEIFASNPSFTL